MALASEVPDLEDRLGYPDSHCSWAPRLSLWKPPEQRSFQSCPTGLNWLAPPASLITPAALPTEPVRAIVVDIVEASTPWRTRSLGECG